MGAIKLSFETGSQNLVCIGESVRKDRFFLSSTVAETAKSGPDMLLYCIVHTLRLSFGKAFAQVGRSAVGGWFPAQGTPQVVASLPPIGQGKGLV